MNTSQKYNLVNKNNPASKIDMNLELSILGCLISCNIFDDYSAFQQIQNIKKGMFKYKVNGELFELLCNYYDEHKKCEFNSLKLIIDETKPHLSATLSKAQTLNTSPLIISSFVGAMIKNQEAGEYYIKSNDQNLSDLPSLLVDIHKPHGILCELFNYMEDISYRPARSSFIANCLQILSSLAIKNNTKSFFDSKLNIFTMVIGESGSGKDLGQSVLVNIYSELNMTKLISDKPRSDKDMILNLMDNKGKSTYLIDEAHSLFEGINSKNGSPYMKAISSEILKMLTANKYLLSGNHKRELGIKIADELSKVSKRLESITGTGDEKLKLKLKLKNTVNSLILKTKYIDEGIPFPLVNIACSSTPAMFDSIINSESIENGMVSRALVFRDVGREPIKKNEVREAEFEQFITGFRNAIRDNKKIKISASAESLFNKIRKHYDQEQFRNHSYLGALYARLGERLEVVASLLAIISAEVTENDIKYALSIILSSINECNALFLKSEAEDTGDSSDLIEYMKSKIINTVKSGIAKSTLERTCTKAKKYKKTHDDCRSSGLPSPFDIAFNYLIKNNILINNANRITKI